jgi:hypothetical protein
LEIVEKILNADDTSTDIFLSVIDPAFFQETKIKQDYTQFKPRAHYTDSSLLKTYFMAMKWLMREKFYFGSLKLTQAAMILASTIPAEEVTELDKLSQQIFNLIGTDDDVALNELMNYLEQSQLKNPDTIANAMLNWEEIQQDVATLHPQKIQSTAYQTDAP